MRMHIKYSSTWSRSSVSARGEEKVILLIEWYAGRLNSAKARPAKMVSKEVQFYVWPERGTKILAVYGAQPQMEKNGALLLPVGQLLEGEKHCLAFEVSLDAQAAGIHQIMAVQWRYKNLLKDNFKHQPIEAIHLHFTHHLGLLGQQENFYVHKHALLLQSPMKLKKAMLLCEQGCNDQGEWLLRRQGDEMLLLAIREQDKRLMQEAELFYRLSEHCRRMNRSDIFEWNAMLEPMSFQAIT